eukprot:c18784_g1_i2.p1 GENE.c18784_g1_i2~~c18784_g1_i2.p1  ORF type:complete len:322 (+),score=74.74 c18784_g1_i2:352-1317(+)
MEDALTRPSSSSASSYTSFSNDTAVQVNNNSNNNSNNNNRSSNRSSNHSNNNEEGASHSRTPSFGFRKPPLFRPKVVHPTDPILVYPAQSVAVQLTIISKSIFSLIHRKELMHLNWTKTDKEILAPNVTKFATRLNIVAGWAQDAILKPDEESIRISTMSALIDVAAKCKELQNYQDCLAICAAFGYPSILKLELCLARLPAEKIETLKQLKQMFKKNSEYREMLTRTSSGCVPFIGIFLTDLTNINEIPTFSGKQKLINFNKQFMIYRAIKQIEMIQHHEYKNLEKIPELYNMLDQIKCDKTEDELYKRALEIEQKHRHS